MEAIAHLRAAHGVSAADVARVRVRTFAEVAGAFNLPAPQTIIDAQFALPYVIALELHDRSPAAGMDEKDIRDPRILATARQVELVEDPAMTAAFEDTGEMPAEVEVQTVDGRAYRRRVGVPKGDPARPLGTDEIERKARLLIEPVAGGAKAHAFIQRIRDLERHGAADLLPPLFDGDGAAPPVARGWRLGEPTPMGS
ncbi:MAG: MmgE/PrpD family protein [Candidatus Rokubacteria bacterium]|nr:MmgE/PrpD family protein [Candidatus Rokubacteria bacterium]